MNATNSRRGQKIYSVFAWIAGLVLSATTAQATTPIALLVWYPGGGGTATTAGPLMDRWAAYLSAQMPETTWTIYFAGTAADGIALLRNKHPALVLPSHVMRVRHNVTGTTVARSIPAGLGKNVEQWFFVHNSCTTPLTDVLASEPLDKLFVANLFPTFPRFTAIQPTNNLLGALRRMAGGECLGAYLTEREWTNMERAFHGVTEKLIAEPSTHAVPTPQIIARPNTIDEKLAEQIGATLRNMSRTNDGKAILQELQLTKFE